MPASTTDDAFVADLTAAQPALFRYILALMPDAVQAEDVLQEVNLLIWQKRDELDELDSFLAWAKRVAFYKVLSLRRDRGRDKLIFNDAVLQMIHERESGSEHEPRRMAALKDCVAALPNKQRFVLLSHYTDGLSFERLADELDRSIPAVSQLMYRIRKGLHACIRSRLSEGK